MAIKVTRNDLVLVLGLLFLLAPTLSKMPPPWEWGWSSGWEHGGVILGLVIAWLRKSATPTEKPEPSVGVLFCLTAAIVLAPSMLYAQTPTPPPGLLASANRIAVEVAKQDVTPPKPAGRPAMGPFCGRAQWVFDEDADAWVGECLKPSKLYVTLKASSVVMTTAHTVLSTQAAQDGKSIDPLGRIFSGVPWAAAVAQGTIAVGEQFVTQDWFSRHPTLSGVVDVALAVWRTVGVIYIAAQ